MQWGDRGVGKSCWFPIVSASYTIDHLRLKRVSFLTGLYLECRYEDLRCLRNKTNMPEGEPIRISYTFSQTCKQETKYNISDITI